MKKTLIISFLLASVTAKSQENYFGQTPSSSGASIGMQNNLYDGSAIVSVPFFNTTIDGIPIDLSIAYTTKGIKPDQVASTVGLGWELMGGASISRIQKDRPDEQFVPITDCIDLHDEQQFPIGNLLAGAWFYQTNDYHHSITSRLRDDELDEFVLNMGGSSVKFSIDRDGDLITVPKNDKIRVLRKIAGVPVTTAYLPAPSNYYTIYGELTFEVTDEMGNIYYFKKGDYQTMDYEEYADDKIPDSYDCNPPLYTKINKWVVERISTYEGNNIYYTYTNFPLSNLVVDVNQYIDYKSLGGQSAISEKYVKVTGGIAALNKITIPSVNKSIDLLYDMTATRHDVPGSRALKEIKITDEVAHVNTTISNLESVSFKFYYAYFNSNSVSTSGMPTAEEISFPYSFSAPAYPPDAIVRLKLKSIDKVAGANTEDYFDFEYVEGNNKRPPFRYNPGKTYYSGSVPTSGRDVYGYSNGKNGIHNCLAVPNTLNLEYRIVSHTPQVGFASDEIGVVKNSDPTYAVSWNLKKVKNGMKGETEFVYYTSVAALLLSPSTTGSIITPVSLSSTCDGAVLRQTINRDGLSSQNDLISEYDYYNGNPNDITSQRFISHGVASYSLKYGNVVSMIFYGTMLTSILPVNGSNHGFGFVRVTQKNSSNAVLGFSEYYFSNANFNDYNATGIPPNNCLTANSTLYPSGTLYNPTTATNFFKTYYDAPFTNKTYFRSWAMGLPIKVIEKDANNLVLSEKTFKYAVTDSYNPTFGNGSKKYLGKEINGGSYPSVFYEDLYYPITGTSKLISTTTKNYVSNTAFITKVETMDYDSYDRIIKVSSTNSKNEAVEVKTFYPDNWNSSNAGPGITLLGNRGIPVLVETWKTIGGVKRLLDVKTNGYGVVNGRARPIYNYEFIPQNGLPSTSYTSGPTSFNMQTASTGGSIANFRKFATLSDFTVNRHPQQVINNISSVPTVKIYNNEKQLVIAEVVNATLQDVAYTGFEYSNSSGSGAVNGNWTFGWMNTITKITGSNPLGLAGDYVFKFDPSAPTMNTITSSITPASNKDYYLTFWMKGGTPPTVKRGTTTLALQTTLLSKNAWVQYIVKFTGNGSAVTLTGTSVNYIDELRLYPVDAEMTSYSFDPLFGISTICTPSNQFVFYEYDAFGRKTITRNHFGEIISKSTYVQQGND